MILGFTAEHETLRQALRPLLARAQRHLLPAGTGPVDAALWQALAEGGWLATAVPESQGGSGLDGASLCMVAEEAGRALAALPLVSSACAFVHLLRSLPETVPPALWAGLADGSARGLLLTEDMFTKPPRLAVAADGVARLSASATNVPDLGSATHALLLAGSGDDAVLLLSALAAEAKAPPASQPLDLLHPCADLELAGVQAPVLARAGAARALWARGVDALALLVAFEQLGGAEAALDAARQYSLQRYAFGRPVGSFQVLKHLMADMLVAIDLARSNCLYGLAALAAGDETLGEAVAVARISATEAFRICAAGSTQVHGALGVTWEADCHLFYRRAQALACSPGSQALWKDRLVRLLQQRLKQNAVAA
jgi:alkylation response protein AidB-like acyl-CoA dehydrogenase